MPKFQVNKAEIWIQPVVVEAETMEEAIEKVKNDEGKIMEDWFEYSHTLDTDSWDVFPA